MASSITAAAMSVNVPHKELCQFFLSNSCRYGDRCFYSHERPNGQSNNICRYYLRGKCMYGDRCRYDHAQPRPLLSFPLFGATTGSFPHDFSHHQPQFLNERNDEESINYANFCYQPPSGVNEEQRGDSLGFTLQTLCPYAGKSGLCEALETGRFCPYLHGAICDLCQLPVLDPNDEQQREQHRLECSKAHKTNDTEALAIQRSQDKKCGICLETVWNREGDNRFGLLENCDHIFCLECIRKWRSSSNYEHKVVKACPECRTKSDFVTPTKFWPENDQAKNDSIQAYKENLQKIHCKFFKRGDGTCPFGSKCFYLHVDKRGQYVQLPPPRRRQRTNAHGELENLSDILMLSLLSTMDVGRFFDELDYLFNEDGDDDDDDDDDGESYGSYPTDEDEFRLVDGHDLTDNDEEFRSWH